MADLDFVKFVARLGFAVGDGADLDEDPDIIWCDGGTIRLTPLVSDAKVTNSATPWLAAFGPIDLQLDANGYATWNGNEYIWLDDLGDGKTNPTVATGNATHRVDFIGITAGGSSVKFATRNVRISADTATDPAHPTIPMLPADGGVCNLAVLSPVPAAGVTPITQGAPGLGIVSIAVDTSNLVTTMTDGSTLTAPVEAAFTTGLPQAVSAAQASASAAATSEANAANSATAAQTAQTAAESARDDAQAAASTATDAFVAHVKGAWSASTAYALDDLATYNGSTYRRLVAGTTAGTPNTDTTNWAVFAQRGVDGTGAVSSVAHKSPDVNGDVELTPSDVGALPSTYVPAWTDVTGKPATFPPSTHTHAESDITGLTADLAAKVNTSAVGAANGVAPLDSGSKVPAAYLPSYVDDVLDYANLAAFPTTGEAGKIYIADDTNKEYRWNTGSSAYIEIAKSPGSTDSLAEGSVNLYFTNARASAAAPVQSVAGQTGAVSAATLKTQLGAGSANGLATLGPDGKVPAAQLPTASGTSAPLVRTSYNTASGAVLTATTTNADVSAANLSATFTAPSTGKIRVALEALVSNGGSQYTWSLRDATNTSSVVNVAGTERLVSTQNANTRVRTEIAVSGLTAGASYTYRWAHRLLATGSGVGVMTGSNTEFTGSTAYGPAIMEVYAE